MDIENTFIALKREFKGASIFITKNIKKSLEITINENTKYHIKKVLLNFGVSKTCSTFYNESGKYISKMSIGFPVRIHRSIESVIKELRNIVNHNYITNKIKIIKKVFDPSLYPNISISKISSSSLRLIILTKNNETKYVFLVLKNNDIEMTIAENSIKKTFKTIKELKLYLSDL